MKTGKFIEYERITYRKNNMFHREDGPAIEYPGVSKQWWLNDRLHRIDGPAVENADGYKAWYINYELFNVKTQEEFEQYMRLKAFH